MNRKHLFGLVAGLVGVLALGFLSPLLLKRASFFRVRRVEVVGARYLTGNEIVAGLKLARNASLFDRVAPIERAAIRIRGVRRASVRRRWPGTLVLRVEEIEPVALTPSRSGLALLDAGGRVLPYDPTRVPADLPVVPADPLLARLVARVRETEPGLFRAIVSASRQRQLVVFEAGDRRFLLRPDAGPAQLRALAAVIDDLARKGRRYRELDARFTDRVFVRGKPS
ncbi:MAG TPA: FtsQ-type POTRA domain-containing protein [Gemmatimonadales bacterium]